MYTNWAKRQRAAWFLSQGQGAAPREGSLQRVSMGLTVNRQMAKKITVNRQKRNVFTVNRQN